MTVPKPDRGSRSSLISDETFMRGLALGALIGAAIAGSTLWSRLRRSPRGDAPPEAVTAPGGSAIPSGPAAPNGSNAPPGAPPPAGTG
jgi:hypothetical protein